MFNGSLRDSTDLAHHGAVIIDMNEQIQILEFLSQSTELSSILNEDEIIGLASHADLNRLMPRPPFEMRNSKLQPLWRGREGEVRLSHQETSN